MWLTDLDPEQMEELRRKLAEEANRTMREATDKFINDPFTYVQPQWVRNVLIKPKLRAAEVDGSE